MSPAEDTVHLRLPALNRVDGDVHWHAMSFGLLVRVDEGPAVVVPPAELRNTLQFRDYYVLQTHDTARVVLDSRVLAERIAFNLILGGRGERKDHWAFHMPLAWAHALLSEYFSGHW